MIVQERHGTRATASLLIEEHEVLAPDSPREAIAPDCPGDSQQWLSARHWY